MNGYWYKFFVFVISQQGHGHHNVVEDAQHALVSDDRGASVQLG